METKAVTPAVTPVRPTTRSFYGRGKFRYAVYPDYWKKSWGDKPLLGYVYADDEFYAKREAYNRNLLILNFTFGPKVVKLTPKPVVTTVATV